MLKSHMDAVENHLVQISQIPANSGHTLHIGTPRGAFIKDFLEGHGTDATWIPGQRPIGSRAFSGWLPARRR